MKQRVIVYLIIFFLFLDYCIENENSKLERQMIEKLIYAVDYYKDVAKHYYLKCTGQLPIPIRFSPEAAQCEMLCDALIVEPGMAEEMRTEYRKAHFESMKQFQIHPGKWESMGENQRREQFKTLQEETARLMAQKWNNVFTQEELKLFFPILTKRIYFPDPDLRALRYIGLTEGQRRKLQPHTVRIIQFLIPESEPFRLYRSESTINPDDPKELKAEKDRLSKKAEDLLTHRQLKSWKRKSEEVEASVTQMRERYREMRIGWVSEK